MAADFNPNLIREVAQDIVDNILATDEYKAHTKRVDNLVELLAEDNNLDERDIRNQVHFLLYKADLEHAFMIRNDYLNYIPHQEEKK